MRKKASTDFFTKKEIVYTSAPPPSAAAAAAAFIKAPPFAKSIDFPENELQGFCVQTVNFDDCLMPNA